MTSPHTTALTFVLALAVLGLSGSACNNPDDPGKLVPKTVEEDPSLPRITIAGTTLHAEAIGDPSAPLIIVLHGGPGGDYRSLLPYRALADDGYRVVFWDQRGSGRSKREAASTYTLALYLEDLRQVIERFSRSKTQPITFLGHSWGAMYATWFIDTYGDYGGRVTGAVLSEPGAFTSRGLDEYMSRSSPWGATSEELNDLVWSEEFMSPNEHARADFLRATAVVARFPKEHNDPKNPAPIWRQGAVASAKLLQLGLDEGFDWTTHLRTFPHKVLFLRGELNETMPLAHQQELASHFAESEVITIAGAGHEAIWEKQDEFLVRIRAYLAETKAAAISDGGAK